MVDLNGIGSAIPDFGSPVLQGIEFEQSSTPGVLQQKSSGRQHVKFYWKEEYNVQKAARLREAGDDQNKAFEKKLYVLIVTPGDGTEIDTYADDSHKRRYFREYKAFKEGKTVAEGQSIDSCEFILAPEATELHHMSIHTVEQLADASDTAMEQLPRGFELREHARGWCKATHGANLLASTKKISAELNETRALAEKLAKANEDMQRQLTEMRAEMRAKADAELAAAIAEPIEVRKKVK